ncbi:S8 family peptidase [Halorubellus litoreus]|uniref:S8 family serine peptidase n=1 Tax=Halorubellus litoreus TaxID=755308 RepID=A0ABD5VH10_9EURY
MGEYSRRSALRAVGAAIGGLSVGVTVTAAERTDRFVVRTKGRTTAGDVEAAGLSVVHDLTEVGYVVAEGSERDAKRAPGEYAPDVSFALDGAVESASVDEHAASATDEPFYGLQWDKRAQGVPTAHETTRGEGARVAIIDTGVAASHPDLAHAVNEDLSRNFTGDGQGAANAAGGYHGTHVAGIVAANDENEFGTVGTAPGAELVDCRVFADDGDATFGGIMAAIAYSASAGCDVANVSLGSYPIPRAAYGRFLAQFLHRTTSYATRNGTLLVASTGNDGANLKYDGPVVSIPAEAPDALAVSATGPIGFNHGDPGVEDGPDTPAPYSNHGSNVVDLSAPGGNYDTAFPQGWFYDLVLSTASVPQFDAAGDYAGAAHTHFWMSGTSMAAPQVAGVAALVSAVDGRLKPKQVQRVLEQTAADAPGGKEYHGKGFVDPVAALESLS